MGPQTVVAEAAAPLPPQLADVLSDNASNVAEMCFLAPGIPWSNQLLDDTLDDVLDAQQRQDDNRLVAECIRGGTHVRAAIVCVATVAHRYQPGKMLLEASVYAKSETDPYDIVHNGVQHEAPPQPADRAGLRKQIEWCQQKTNNIFRRGFCAPCYDPEGNVEQRPRKRLRVGGAQMCSQCMFKRCL